MTISKPAFLLLIALISLASDTLSAAEVLRFGNTLFQKSFIAESTQPDGIYIDIFDENDKQVNNRDYAYFQFHVNNHLIKSTDKIWEFTNYTKREMGNGGMEYMVNFEITTGACKGLNVTILQQFFVESALIREKLVLSADINNDFRLTKYNGTNHFQFPNYQILSIGLTSSNITEINLASWEVKPTTFGPKAKGNHMYYPNITQAPLDQNYIIQKGPVVIATDGQISWFTAYEHASQDDTKGMFDETKKDKKLIVDAMQGTKGVFNFSINDEDFMFLGINASRTNNSFMVGVSALRGAYYSNEKIDLEHPYSSVWTATCFYKGEDFAKGKSILRNYILNQICEQPITRKIEFYYNTWG